MTLDNTGSMYESCNSAATCSESRMERMRMAAKGLVNALFDAQRQRVSKMGDCRIACVSVSRVWRGAGPSLMNWTRRLGAQSPM